MRLFLVERTSLPDLSRHPNGPKTGDVVAYFRAGQVSEDGACSELTDTGVEIVRADTFLDSSDIERLDRFVDAFTRCWTIDNGVDVSRAGDISIGMIVSPQLITAYEISLLVHSGEVFSRILKKYSHATEVLSDIIDGETPILDYTALEGSAPRWKLLVAMVGQTELKLTRLKTRKPIPSRIVRPDPLRLGFMIKTFLGGFRFRYLIPRLRLRFQSIRKPRVFFSTIIYGIGNVATRLSENGGIDVIGSGPPRQGLTPLRFDHFLPIPTLTILKGIFRLRKHIARERRKTGDWVLSGFDYGPFFWKMADRLCGKPLFTASIKISQTQRLLNTCNPSITVIGSESHTDTRTLIESGPYFGYESIYIPDGIGKGANGYSVLSSNYPNVINAVPGDAHRNYFGQSLPESHQPRCVNVPNPLTLQVNHLRGKYPGPSSRRVLMIGYGPDHSMSSKRISYMDDYTIAILVAAKKLAAHGVRITLRPHHGEQMSYYRYLMEKTGTTDLVDLNWNGSFADALAEHSIFVSNVSTCYYQALYAGWPTIFFDPVYEPSLYSGLPSEPEWGAPVASRADDLVDLILEGLSPENKIVEFACGFEEKLSPRFIGPEADRADEIVAHFLEQELARFQQQLKATPLTWPARYLTRTNSAPQ